MRLSEDRWSRTTPTNIRDQSGWATSGVITASVAIKAEEGLLGGVLVTATDAGGDIDVIMYDDPDSASGEELARVTITTGIAKYQESFAAPSKEGVHATLGIWCEIVGDCEVIVYYK